MTTENLRALTETLMRSPASLIRGVKVPDRKPGRCREIGDAAAEERLCVPRFQSFW